jgi:hypothetical protein
VEKITKARFSQPYFPNEESGPSVDAATATSFSSSEHELGQSKTKEDDTLNSCFIETRLISETDI